MTLRRALLSLAASSLLLAACGGAGIPAAFASPTPTETPSATPAPTATPAESAAAGSVTFTIASGSKAVVKVTEQLADRKDLSDAVLTTDKVTGSFTIQPDGAFSSSSRITADLTALSSDSRQRDNFVKTDTLSTRQFPTATFVPTKTEGLTLPLAASGDMSFKLMGQLTIHGVTKDVVFDVKATRGGTDLTATATITPAMKFGTFGMTPPRVFTVLSIKDEIRLEVQLVAKQS